MSPVFKMVYKVYYLKYKFICQYMPQLETKYIDIFGINNLQTRTNFVEVYIVYIYQNLYCSINLNICRGGCGEITGSCSTFEFPSRVNISGPSLYCIAETLGK